MKTILAILLLPVVAFGQGYNPTNATTLFTSKPLHIFSAGQTVVVSNGLGGAVTLYTASNTVVATGTGTVSANGVAPGWYYAQSASDKLAVTVLPSGYGTPSWWGDNGWWIRFPGTPVTQTWWKVWDAAWEYNCTNWTFTDAISTNKAALLIIHDGSPCNTTNDATAWLAAYKQYASNMLVRVRANGVPIYGVIPVNEPGPSKFPVADWIPVLKGCIDATKQVLTDIGLNVPIVAPDWWSYNGYGSTRTLEASNGFVNVTKNGYHDYEMAFYPPDVTTPGHLSIPERVMTNKVGSLPLWVDEIGIGGTDSLGYPMTGTDPALTNDWRIGYRRAMKTALLYRAAGVERLHTHELAGGSYAFTTDTIHHGLEPNGRGLQARTAAWFATLNRMKDWTNITTNFTGNTWTVSGYDTNLNQTISATWRTEGSGTGALPAGATDVWGNTMGGLLADEVAFFRNPVGGGSGALVVTNYITTNYVVYVTNTVTRCYSVDRYGRKKLITCP